MHASNWTISADAEADLCITDWTEPALQLTLTEQDDGMFTATLQLPDAGAVAFDDLMPRRFGSVVLCLGPNDDAAWPDDVELLERLLRPLANVFSPAEAAPAPLPDAPAAAASVAATQRRRVGMWGVGAAAALAMAGALGLIVSASGDAAAARQKPLSLFARVFESVRATGIPQAEVYRVGDRVVVEGLFNTTDDAVRLRDALAPFEGEAVEQRYAAAPDIAQSITDTLAAPGIQVSHVGKGAFLVSGRAMHLDRLRASASRLVVDLAPLVREIRFEVVELPAPPRMPVGAMLSADGVEYVQSRDGSKFISITAGRVAAGDSPQTRNVISGATQ
ncbi:MAG TPA: hypothetical protein VFR90_10670 [Methylibium sp.]|uniref:hypothetical protein n=1 Tax=Methylibium sp. TaxID=2067992 RepID=UPI002DBBAF97|nr:hypothetical protein [Methylibium sp.]HEU4459576.1 hypothetical protein [Methylibium sp.]